MGYEEEARLTQILAKKSLELDAHSKSLGAAQKPLRTSLRMASSKKQCVKRVAFLIIITRSVRYAIEELLSDPV